MRLIQKIKCMFLGNHDIDERDIQMVRLQQAERLYTLCKCCSTQLLLLYDDEDGWFYVDA